MASLKPSKSPKSSKLRRENSGWNITKLRIIIGKIKAQHFRSLFSPCLHISKPQFTNLEAQNPRGVTCIQLKEKNFKTSFKANEMSGITNVTG
ncbi:Uncharacterized protein TCM_035806 [Theobroma cacao]|uniref:Uncharacterized protein n=1 Tax=Theobroma cacao TaxID=3641 RepID=A0A061FIG3_THECC|nr:Uncharacterized protein TCM_035806 [Theobroma cacao]